MSLTHVPDIRSPRGIVISFNFKLSVSNSCYISSINLGHHRKESLGQDGNMPPYRWMLSSKTSLFANTVQDMGTSSSNTSIATFLGWLLDGPCLSKLYPAILIIKSSPATVSLPPFFHSEELAHGGALKPVVISRKAQRDSVHQVASLKRTRQRKFITLKIPSRCNGILFPKRYAIWIEFIDKLLDGVLAKSLGVHDIPIPFLPMLPAVCLLGSLFAFSTIHLFLCRGACSSRWRDSRRSCSPLASLRSSAGLNG